MRKTQRVRPEETTPLLRTRALYGSLDIVFATSPLSESLGQTNTVIPSHSRTFTNNHLCTMATVYSRGGGGGTAIYGLYRYVPR